MKLKEKVTRWINAARSDGERRVYEEMRPAARGLERIYELGGLVLPCSGVRNLCWAGEVGPGEIAAQGRLFRELTATRERNYATWLWLILSTPGTRELRRRYSRTDLHGRDPNGPDGLCRHGDLWVAAPIPFAFCPTCQHAPEPDDDPVPVPRRKRPTAELIAWLEQLAAEERVSGSTYTRRRG